MVLPERLDKLQMAIAQIQMGQPYPLLIQHLAKQDGQPEPVPIYLESFFCIRDNDGEMVQACEHKPPYSR